MGGPWAFYIPQTLLRCTWWLFYDILEQVARRVEQQWKGLATDDFNSGINVILAREGIQWKLAGDRVIRVLEPQVAGQVIEVRVLLTDPKFKGPDEKFAKAVGFLSQRPQPDEENCIKDAVGALEAVANIVSGTSGIQLNSLLDREPLRSSVHPTIRQAVKMIYAYRGAAPGVGHAQVGPATVTVAEAKWVLTTSAASILYLASKLQV